MIRVQSLLETDHTQHRLGRHVEHDERSRDFRYRTMTPFAYPTDTVRHRRYVPVFDQGELGSCTGNALAGALMTGGLHNHGALKGTKLSEVDAIDLYEEATRLDSFPGIYPPNDTGSSGLAVCKAAKARGWITAYTHVMGGLKEVLAALRHQPVIIGVPWYDSFDRPDPTGFVRVTPGATVRGGHEFVLEGFNGSRATVLACNSWGTKWGHKGHFEFDWTDLVRLLGEDGDCTVPLIA